MSKMREPRQYLETDMLKEIIAMNPKYSKIVSSKVVKVRCYCNEPFL